MTPGTHTFWDPQKGKYVTIPLANVIKPPTDDEQTAHKAVVAVDAVVTKVVGGFVSGFLKALLFLVFVLGVCGAVPDHNTAASIICCAIGGWIAWRFFKAFWSGYKGG
jgi:hypothetical protein